MMRLLTCLIALCSSTAMLAQTYTRTVGNKSLELSNHLGNVLEVTTDRKIQQNTEAEIVAFNDYYPYGMLMENRNGTLRGAEGYRYAFQGQEKDNEIKGQGNSFDFGARKLDNRIGRWMSIDAYEDLYVGVTPYGFSLNSPINFIDIDGNEVYDSNGNKIVMTYDENGNITGFNHDIAEDTKKLLTDNFLDTKVGQSQLETMDKTKTKIEFEISSKAAFIYNEKNETYELALGETETSGNIKEEDGTKTFKKAKIFVYQGSLDLLTGKSKVNEEGDYIDLSFDKRRIKGKKLLKSKYKVSHESPGPHQTMMKNDIKYSLKATLIHESEHTTSRNKKLLEEDEDYEAPAFEKEKELFKETTNENKK